jgi:hypothetical protein
MRAGGDDGTHRVSIILYTCAEFDDAVAIETTRDLFELTAWTTASV